MPSNPLLSKYIIGDPGAGSGCMYAINAFKPYSSPNKSWETQGQIVGMRKSLNGGGGGWREDFPSPPLSAPGMVPIYTTPNAPTHPTILFDQSISTEIL